jgi:hypothetical protein
VKKYAVSFLEADAVYNINRKCLAPIEAECAQRSEHIGAESGLAENGCSCIEKFIQN